MSRRAVLFGVIAAVVVLAAWYMLLWNPAQGDLDEAKGRTEAASARNSQLESEIARLREVQRSEPLRRAQLETLRTAIPDTPNLAQFILDANDAAAKSGIDFISIAPQEPRAAAVAVAPATTPTTAAAGGAPAGTPTAATAAPAEVAIQLQISGGYFQVLDFLNRMDNLPRLVVTDAVNMTADAATGRLTAGLTARMFVRSIPSGFAGATPTPATTTTTAAGGATTTTAVGGATTTTAPGATTTTTRAGG